MLGQHLASYIDTQRQRHNQNAPATQRVNGYIIGVIKCRGTSAWEKTYFTDICSSFEYASFAVDVVSKVPAVGGAANLGDSTAMLSLSFVYDAQHTVWKPRRANELNDSINLQAQLTTLTNRMNGVDGALTTMLGALQTSMAAMQNLGTQLTQGQNDIRRAMLEGTQTHRHRDAMMDFNIQERG
ncbi:hypothetical protein MVLG_04423 [Microbotryum lychnidis-dioicae p1A1 Lamole]|uniref:Uncharacterized protein n=1 Tax=Microbotryum lychnidis-dioicae (strain p1A1 Lamole / MvSl-1064) TaxID=683840 RepID=U5HB65_USTV1|nr:hypothetical protein MVLG_04423 [Microbotryum lychnidis-dioicae p1A1 Lamole]|eukprot:KDE05181.1 hypothetical protein MVLG_04423 [Microbotryum lychnidis-dioicae p1A1 Lamole]